MYLFGSPDECYGQDVANLLQSIFTIRDEVKHRDRNIILVGHSIRSDIREIKRSANFDILSLQTVKAIIDTSLLLYTLYHTSSRYYSLRQMCTILGMYKRNIHNAGNDAMYTLKALLLIFSHYKAEKIKWSFTSEDQAMLYSCQLEAINKLGRSNNSIGKLARYRLKKRTRRNAGEKRAKAAKSHDLLTCSEGEEGMMDGLFTR